MASKDITIKIGVDAKTGKLKVVKGELADIGKTAKYTAPKVDKVRQVIADLAHTGLALDFLSDLFGSIKSAASAFFDTASEFEQYKNRMSAFTTSSKETNAEMARARAFANEYNQSIAKTTETLLLMKNYGLDASNKSLKVYTNTAIGAGKSIEQFAEAMADALTGENERLKEFGVKASTEAGKVTYAWTDSLGRARNITIQNNKDIIDSTLRAIFNEKYAGQIDKYKNSWAGMVQGLSNIWTNFKLDLADSGLFAYFRSLGNAIYDYIKTGADGAKSGVSSLVEGIMSGVESIITAFGVAGDTISLFAGVFHFIETAYWELVAFIGEGINKIGAGWTKLTNFISEAWATVSNGVKMVFQEAINIVIDDINALTGVINKAANAVHLDNIFEPIKHVKFDKTVAEIKKVNYELVNADMAWLAAKESQGQYYKDFKKVFSGQSQKSAENLISSIRKNYEGLNKTVAANNKEQLEARKQLDKLGAKYGAVSTIAQNSAKKSAAAHKSAEKSNRSEIKKTLNDQIHYYEQSGDYAKAWAAKEKLLRQQNTALTKQELDKQIELEKKKYLQSKGIYESLSAQISANIAKVTKDWQNSNEIVSRGFGSLVTNLQSSMQSGIVDVFAGKTKTIGGFFSNIWKSIKTSFFNMVAEIASKQIVMGFINMWKGNPNTGKGFVESFLGIDIPFLNFAEGTIWGSDNRYGVVNNTYRYKDSYANDTIPALISPGEAVIPASAVARNKAIVSALIAGSRLENRGLLDISYVKRLTADAKKKGYFALGYDPNELAMLDKASIDAETGVYKLKGGAKNGKKGAIFGALIGIFTGGLGTALIGAALGGAAGYSGVLDPIIKMVGDAFKALMKNPWLGWVLQAGLALAAPALIPTMLTSDLMSAGITLATGGDLSQALGSAGISGLLAGGGAALSSVVQTGAMPASKLTFWETIRNYPTEMYNKMLEKWADVKKFLGSVTDTSALADPLNYTDLEFDNWLTADTPLDYDTWVKQGMQRTYNSLSGSTFFDGTSFGNGGSFMDYGSAYNSWDWGFSNYGVIGQPASSMGVVDWITDKLSIGADFAKSLGSSVLDYLQYYLQHPEEILQYILNHIADIIMNIVTTIAEITSSPIVAALIGSGITNKQAPFGGGESVHAFAKGGIVTAPTLGIVGEAGYAEAVIPLHQLGEVTGADALREEIRELKAILKGVLNKGSKSAMYLEKMAAVGVKTL